ncbi:unnamed protein product [Allacma fusca]|uniref:CRAL-TRIO domain-containing protein n=1 Tax=Allacma fusca TaxID=39272 RepID=A0A8J2PRG9_9HEXA|nr:unnamed protein product [Allacma fusca]
MKSAEFLLLSISIVATGALISNNTTNSTQVAPPRKKQLKNITLSHVTWTALANLTDNDILPNGQSFGEYEVPFNMSSRYYYYLTGYDFDAQPVWIIEIGRWDMVDAIKRGQVKELDLYFKQFAYRALREIRKQSTPERPITQDVLILDFANLRLDIVTDVKSLTYALGAIRDATYIIKNFTAEVIIINANFAAETLIRQVGPILGAFFEHITVYGNNKDKWIPRLRRKIPSKFLPECPDKDDY